jgi:hypothetical protein
MKRIVKLLLLSIAVAEPVTAILAQSSFATKPTFSLSINTLKPKVILGSDIDIGISLTNVSDHPITLTFGHAGNVACCYEYDVLDEQGVPVAKVGKRYAQLPNGERMELPKIGPGSVAEGTIAPGKGEGSNSTISDKYQFDHPGKYTIQVSRQDPEAMDENGNPVVVRSNTLTITVLPTDSTPSATQ